MMQRWMVAANRSRRRSIPSFSSFIENGTLGSIEQTDIILRAKSWSSPMWRQTRDSVKYWSQQIHGLDQTWKLLDRAVAHAEYHYSRRTPDAEVILRDLLEAYESTEDPDLIPAGYYFHSLIHSYIRAFDESGFEDQISLNRADDLLATMLKYSKISAGIKPDINTFEIVLNSWEKSKDPKSCYRATHTLDALLQHANNHDNIQLEARTFEHVLQTWMKAPNHKTVLLNVESILKKMQDHQVSPTTKSINFLLHAWSESEQPNAADQVEMLLQKMINDNIMPDWFSFNTIMSVYAKTKSKDAVERAEVTLKHMHQLSMADGDDATKRDDAVHCYNKLLQMYADHNLPHKADALIHQLCDDGVIIHGNNKQSRIAFSTAIFAWSRDNKIIHAASNAEALFIRMKDLNISPSAATYASLILTFATSLNQDKAEAYLEEMINAYKSGNISCKPHQVPYTSVINGWALSRDPDALVKARNRFEEMKNYCQPSKGCYAALIRCLARSSCLDKVEKACQIVSDMEQQSIEPDQATWNAVLMVCAYSNHGPIQESVFQVALDIFQKRCYNPTHQTFTFFFTAAIGMNGYDRELEAAYKLCCDYGFSDHIATKKAIEEAIPHLFRNKQD